ncbi:sensor histidine kinase [Agromyces sp. MMS24-JH15]|uniref:sensor histidine kinase n=1 Tax=Agromyces sp. MMS24-JH15 TaxID=3243765 RepID=UPI00374A5FF9
MESTWVVVAALALGAFLGAAFMIVVHMAERRGQTAAAVAAPTLPEGISSVLAVLESAGVVLDPSNNVLKASPSALALGLVRDGALVHRQLLDVVADVRATGETVAEELTLARGPFGEATLLLRVRAARLGSRFVLLLAEDRTEANRLEEVRRDFVANISHELKTPIASVGLLAEAIDLAAAEPEQVRRFANRLEIESGRLARITNEIIQLSRLQASDALEADVLVDIDEAARAAVEQNRVVAAGKEVEVAVRAKTGAQVWGDQALIVVAIHNLVANAIAYSNAGGRVGVGVRVDGDVVQVAVTDQGIGIAEADLDRVFERFYRVDQARARETGGTGLGLSIVKHTVQNLGGDVRAWSNPGRGSTFTIRLPLAERPPGDGGSGGSGGSTRGARSTDAPAGVDSADPAAEATPGTSHRAAAGSSRRRRPADRGSDRGSDRATPATPVATTVAAAHRGDPA